MKPYYTDDTVTLYHGDCREIAPALGRTVDLIVADPPYGETSLSWDRWPNGWPNAMIHLARSLWCFGSMRMFFDNRDEFLDWRLSQDVVWRKPAAVSPMNDRFRRNHEHAVHFYRGPWGEIHHDTPRHQTGILVRHSVYGRTNPTHFRQTGKPRERGWVDTGTRLMQSVIDAPSMYRKHPEHPTQKTLAILDPLIRYGCPDGGTVLDPFAGSGSTAEAARLTGRKAVLIEAVERYCEIVARRMSQGVLTDEGRAG